MSQKSQCGKASCFWVFLMNGENRISKSVVWNPSWNSACRGVSSSETWENFTSPELMIQEGCIITFLLYFVLQTTGVANNGQPGWSKPHFSWPVKTWFFRLSYWNTVNLDVRPFRGHAVSQMGDLVMSTWRPRLVWIWVLHLISREDLLPHTYCSQYRSHHSAHFCHTNIHLPFVLLLIFLSRTKSATSRVHHITPSPIPQVYPLQVSASPRYSGFSAVGVTNPLTCLGAPPSLSSVSGLSTAAALATALALATRSR